jgi:hypothetical protein
MTRRFMVVAVALSLPLLAACGDKKPSKQDFVAEADPVCKRGNDIAAVFTTPSDLGMMKDFGTKLADNITKTADEVDKLDKPGGDDGKAAADLVKSMKDAGAAAREIAAPVDQANYPGVEAAVTKTVEAFKAADGKARAFGSAECGKGEAAAAAKLGETSGATVKTAFIAKADGICKGYNTQFEGIKEPEDFNDVKPFLDQSIALVDKLTAELKAIPQPTIDKGKLDEAFASNDAAVAKLKEASAAAGARDEDKTIDLLDEATVLGDTSNAKADAYGFKDCGSQGG